MKAIDFHVHLATHEWIHESLGPMWEATVRHFRTEVPVRSIDDMAEEFRGHDVVGVLLAWDAESGTGLPPLTNDYVAGCVEKHPDAFVGFASVDPWKGKAAVAQHKTTVWLELSGWSPRLWSPELTKAVLGPLSDRALFGTDYPFITFPKWLKAFRAYEPAPDVEEKILLGNARRLLRL